MADMLSIGKSAMNVRAVVRAASILRSFRQRPLQTLAEISTTTGLDKGTTRRLLVTLMNTGFVVQDPVSQKYGLGRMIRILSSSVVDHFDLRSVAVPVLTAIASELHLTTFLSVYQDHSALCLERLHDMKGMEVHWWPVGGTLPINTGGGQLSAGQAGASGGMIGVYEAVVQLRHEAGKRQVKNCTRGVVTGYGAVSYGRGPSASACVLARA